MPGICGIATGRGNRPPIMAMCQTMRDQPWYFEEHYRQPGIALAALSLGGAKLYRLNANGTSYLAAMAGEILGYDGQRRRLERMGCKFDGNTHVELFLRGYLEEGGRFIRQLHGSFSVAIWSADARQLRIITDHFGLKPIYYTHCKDGLVFASSAKALFSQAGVSARLSQHGIAQFFGFGHFLGEDTLHADVHIIPAAATLIFDAPKNSLAIERYWELAEAFVPSPHRSREAALEKIDAAFSASMARCVSDAAGLGLSLSGGLDSRTILAAVPQDKPLTCVTLGAADSIDLRIAKRLANLSKRRLYPYILDRHFIGQFEKHLLQMVRLTDGQYITSSIVMPSLELYRKVGVRTLLRGHGGELLHMDKAYAYSLPKEAVGLNGYALKSWLYQRLAARLMSGPEKELFLPPYRSSILAMAWESFDRCFDEANPVQPHLHRISYFFVKQFLRRATALSMAKFGSVVETRLPFVDRDVIGAVMAAPPELKFGDQIQAYMMSRQAPDFVGVPNANTGARLGVGPVVRAAAQGRLRLLARLGVSGYQPYERLGRWLRRDLQPLIKRILLSDACLDRGVFAPETVRKVIDDHVDGRANHSYLIMAMLAFELGQQELVDGRKG